MVEDLKYCDIIDNYDLILKAHPGGKKKKYKNKTLRAKKNKKTKKTSKSCKPEFSLRKGFIFHPKYKKVRYTSIYKYLPASSITKAIQQYIRKKNNKCN